MTGPGDISSSLDGVPSYLGSIAADTGVPAGGSTPNGRSSAVNPQRIAHLRQIPDVRTMPGSPRQQAAHVLCQGNSLVRGDWDA